MRMTPEQFQQHVLQDVRPAKEPFIPTARYIPEGDCIEFLAVAESFYGERIDDLVTVFYSNSSGEVVGSLIKGVKNYLRKHPNLIVTIEDGKIKIAHLLISKAITSGKLEDVAIRKYQRLIKVAEEMNVTFDLPDLEVCAV